MSTKVVDESSVQLRVGCSNKDWNRPAVVSAYVAGESLKSISDRIGISRPSLLRHLKQVGVPIRGGSSANLLRFARSTREERLAITEAAHAAVRGVPHTREHKLKIAQGRSKPGCIRIGAGEQDFAAYLRERGHTVVEQAAIDVYNVDLLVGAVVVELRCDTTRPTKFPAQAKRIEDIRGLGYPLLYVCFRRVEHLWLNLDQVVADLDVLGRFPSGKGEYRMVWCGAEYYTKTRDDQGKIRAHRSPERAIYRTRESDLRVAG
jgi:hypothetical protein